MARMDRLYGEAMPERVSRLLLVDPARPAELAESLRLSAKYNRRVKTLLHAGTEHA
jgi:hypothetical protein